MIWSRIDVTRTRTKAVGHHHVDIAVLSRFRYLAVPVCVSFFMLLLYWSVSMQASDQSYFEWQLKHQDVEERGRPNEYQSSQHQSQTRNLQLSNGKASSLHASIISSILSSKEVLEQKSRTNKVANAQSTKRQVEAVDNMNEKMAYVTHEMKQNQSTSKQYKLWEPAEISSTLLKWADHYPELVRVTTSQDLYSLPTAGGANDCPHDKGVVGCLNYILTIQDFIAHPEGSESSKRLPEVLWSGELHGNEQVGPTAVLEAAQLLLDSASCESHPRLALLEMDNIETIQHELDKARTCQEELLAESGVTAIHRKWLARLVSTRRIVVIPTANALGYYQKKREEGDIDANRDFPYDLTDPRDCMKTVAGRTVNEVFRDHLFQLSLTFHGGMEVIGYEWGAPTWLGSLSPDDTAQKLIASAYSHFAGAFGETPAYDYGNMNDKVYYVRGGMEDWAYAGAFDSERVVQCEPNTYGGYPKEKTLYDNSTLRVFNMLVEASDDKIPRSDSLGSSYDLFNPESVGNGHIARNIRLALLAVDLVEPYVTITGVALEDSSPLQISDDIVPLVSRDWRTCMDTKTAIIAYRLQQTTKVTVTFTVGGALEINNVAIWFGKWDDIPTDKLDCLQQPNILNIQKYMTRGEIIGPTTGTGKYSDAGTSNQPFVAAVDLRSSNLLPGDRIVVIASAQVDQSWGETMSADIAAPKGMPPQSHIVNARTNPNWYHNSSTGNQYIQGRLDWFSIPLTIVFKEVKDPTIEVSSDRYEFFDLKLQQLSSETSGSGTGKNESKNDHPHGRTTKSWISMIIMASSIMMFCYCLIKIYFQYSSLRTSQRERIRDFIEDPEAVSPGLRQKVANVMNSNKHASYYRDGSNKNNRYLSDDMGLEMPTGNGTLVV